VNNFSATSWQETILFWWNDDDICLELHLHADCWIRFL